MPEKRLNTLEIQPDFLATGFFAVNSAPTVYSDVWKPVVPAYSTSLKPASSSRLI
ncbi:MAG: hypothetical protein GXP46_11295 [Deferribacteres bacterium]|nr:hypothetical protein [Deferribacteres bacterium]